MRRGKRQYIRQHQRCLEDSPTVDLTVLIWNVQALDFPGSHRIFRAVACPPILPLAVSIFGPPLKAITASVTVLWVSVVSEDQSVRLGVGAQRRYSVQEVATPRGFASDGGSKTMFLFYRYRGSRKITQHVGPTRHCSLSDIQETV